ncbi:MAG: hypothetical protein EHM61_12775 [Acidobacteria bacterium]|nr:MAG: hypothetical protein EHM61_12775 [Acidobacteriota bacterium]
METHKLPAQNGPSFASDSSVTVTAAQVADLLAGRLPAEVRRKPGRAIVRTDLTDGEGGRRRVFMKVYGWGGGRWDRLRGMLSRWRRGGSPAFIESRNLKWAATQGIAVPRLISAQDFTDRGLAFESVLITEELTGMSPLNVAIQRAVDTLARPALRRWKADLADQLARLTELLHQSRRYHKDLYLCHFLVPDEAVTDQRPLAGRLRLLDFLRLKNHPWNWRRWQVKDLAQLLYSSALPGIRAVDRLRFMHAYLGCPKLDRQGRRLLRRVEKKAARYRRQNRGR